MKKFLTFIIIGLLSILVVACSSNEKKTEKISAKQSGKIEEIKERGELVVAVLQINHRSVTLTKMGKMLDLKLIWQNGLRKTY